MSEQTWKFDTAHSSVGFSVKHMMFAKVRGTFDQWDGSVSFNPGDLSSLKTEVSVEIASINTSNEARDNHLKSADFFDVVAFPTMTFSSNEAIANGDKLQLRGSLTIRGTTQPVTLDVERTGAGIDPWGNRRVGFRAKTSINRKDFGLTWNQALEAGGVLVGEQIEIDVEVQVIPA
jgi:polyisoprenoid-binding protein YceI